MKKLIILIILLLSCVAYGFTGFGFSHNSPFGINSFDKVADHPDGETPSNALLLETGDTLLLETGDKLLLE